MVGLTCLEVYNSIFNINEENNKIEPNTDNFDEFSFEKLKYELGEILSISYITPSHLQHEIKRPRNIQACKKIRLDKSSTDGYIISLIGYA